MGAQERNQAFRLCRARSEPAQQLEIPRRSESWSRTPLDGAVEDKVFYLFPCSFSESKTYNSLPKPCFHLLWASNYAPANLRIYEPKIGPVVTRRCVECYH